jgi:hypothetical protein
MMKRVIRQELHDILNGDGLDVLWQSMAAMALLGVIMLRVSLLRFQKSLE